MTIKIIAVGDIMLGDQDLCAGFGVGSHIKKRGANYLFDDVRDILSRGDIVFGNLECSVNRDANIDYKKTFFCACPAVVPALKNAGFNALSVANNHIMQNGLEIYNHTINLLDENKILPVGVRNDVRIKKIHGLDIAFFGYSFIDDKICGVGYNKIIDDKKIFDDISKIRASSDLIIISLHWGLEYVPYASVWQIETARKLIDAGADVILGGHSHVLQGYEIYNGKPIIYSLGNFIFDQTFNPETTISAIFEINIGENVEIKCMPILINPVHYALNLSLSEELVNAVSTAHRNIEGNSISKYETLVVNYLSADNPFHKMAKKHMKRHFCKHFYKYMMRQNVHIIFEYIRNIVR